MANKRVSELASITVAELTAADLVLLSDVTAHESKKLTLQDLGSYLLSNGNLSGSFYGTASWAQNSVSTSFAPTPTLVPSASFAILAATATNANTASVAISASYSLSSSFAATASVALVSSATNAATASFATSSLSASFLIYFPGISNGTSSFAATASIAITAFNADTASFLLGSVATASLAFLANTATTATTANSASYLIFTPGVFNGTASYALSAGLTNGTTFVGYGIFLANTQSALIAQLDNVSINPSTQLASTTSIEAWGSVIVPFTSSTLLNESVTLMVLNRRTGETASLDSAPIYVDIAAIANTWDTYASGTLKMPFSLAGQAALTGSYLVFISASSANISIEPTRTARFDIDSVSDTLAVRVDIPIQFTDTPTNTQLGFTSSDGGPFQDTAAGIVTTGSNKILVLNAGGKSITNIYNVWTLGNLTSLNAGDNPALADIGGMPRSIITMSCQNCNIGNLVTLANTSISILYCNGNSLSSIPSLPSTMSYINCSDNLGITALPDPLPAGLVSLYADFTAVTAPPASMPNTLQTMSFNNTSLALWLTTLPTALSWFSCNNTSLTSLPTIPSNVLYLDVSNGSFTSVAEDNICANLVSNGLNSGSLNLQGNSALLPVTLTRITTLQSRAWTVTT